MGKCCLPDNLDGVKNNPDIQPQPCFDLVGSFTQVARLDWFPQKMDTAGPA